MRTAWRPRPARGTTGRLKSATLIAMLVVALLATGCVTPIEVKQASKAQLDLLAALDSAAGDLQKSLGQFNRGIEERIRDEGRIWIAKQAIEVAVPSTSTAAVTADELFKSHKDRVQPWIDYAFLAGDIDATIKRIQERKNKATDPALKIQLENEELTWERRKAVLARKPDAVKQIEAVILDDLQGQAASAAAINKALEVLRAQIALMKQMATRVDAWLAIDVTVTQEQADALRQSFSAASNALGSGK